MKSTKDQLIDLLIDEYLIDLVSYCSYESQDSDDEVQAFKDLLWYTIQSRINETKGNHHRATGSLQFSPLGTWNGWCALKEQSTLPVSLHGAKDQVQ